MDNRLLLLGGGACLLWGVGYYAAKRAGAAIPANAFNPVSRENLVYQGASAVTEALTGIQGDTPGIWLHRLLNPAYENWDPNAGTPAARPKAATPAEVAAVYAPSDYFFGAP